MIIRQRLYLRLLLQRCYSEPAPAFIQRAPWAWEGAEIYSFATGTSISSTVADKRIFIATKEVVDTPPFWQRFYI